MNDLVAELRAYANSLRDTWKRDAALADRAADEIERLTAERDKLFEQKLAREVAFADLSAERDRLIEEAKSAAAHIAALGYLTDKRVAEIHRLRAALERIAGLGNWYSCEIAREALAGTSDSVVIHGCFCGQGQYGNPRDCPVHGSDRQQTPDISDGKP